MSESRDVDRILDEIGNFIRPRGGYADFLRHRNRYASDAEIVATFYEKGDILEIGSVPCHLTAALTMLGYPCIGVDLAPERCRGIIDRYGLTVEQCNIEREPLPFPERTFRYVLFNEVIEHLRVDPLFALSQINRVLADDGVLMLTTPNLYAIQQIARFATGRGFGDPLLEFAKLRTIGHMGHIREYSHAEIRRFLRFSNFAVENVSYKHYYYPKTKRGMLAYVLFRVLPARFRSYQVVLAKKIGPAVALAPLP